MIGEPRQPDRFEDLRKRAERIVERREQGDTTTSMDSTELRRLLHEIDVYQVEVELQNEELRRTAQELRQSRDEYLDLFHFAPVGFVVLDGSGRIRQINDAAVELLGDDAARLKGQILWKWIYPMDQRRFLDWFTLLAKSQDAADFYDLRVLGQDGKMSHVKFEAKKVPDESGRRKEYRCALTDITDHVRSEKKVRRMNEELERRVEQRTRQLRELTIELSRAEDRERERLAYMLHDELQQKLAAIRMYMQVLAPKTAPQGRLDSALSLIDRAIADTRSLSHKLYPTTLRLHGLFKALERLAEDMKRDHGLEIHLELEPEANPPNEQIASVAYRAVNELLFNVVKHSGVLTARLSARQKGDEIHIDVHDEGVGCDPEEVAAKSTDYSSLGLPSIEERIGYLGGRVDIDCDVGKGFTVSLVLPGDALNKQRHPVETPTEPILATATNAGRTENTVAASAEKSPNGISILLVDDHHLVRDALASTLVQTEDFKVVGQASDGLQALRLVAELAPDVILMDVNMPGMDGIETTAKICQQYAQTAVIGLTMHNDPTTIELMRQAGAVDVLEKSCSISQLSAAIRYHATGLNPDNG